MLTTAERARAQEVRRFFDRESARWSGQYASGAIAERTPRFLDALRARVETPGSVLDVGCGSGDIAVEVACHGWRVTACDISPRMLAAAQARRGANAVSWVQIPESGECLPFASARFTAVYSSSVLEYVPDLAGHMAEVARVLRAGGLYAATVPDMRHPVRLAEQPRQRVARCGPAMALLRCTRWGPQYEYLLTSLNRWDLQEWLSAFRRAGLEPLDVPPCTHPLALLTARKMAGQ